MKKFSLLLLNLVLILIFFINTFNVFAIDDKLNEEEYWTQLKDKNITINVYNWGEYISDKDYNVNQEFYNKTGIKVNYTTYASNEELYARLKGGGAEYDVIFPSDYMISRLISENMLNKLDYKNIFNYKYINNNFKNLEYDINNEYSVPYTWGLVGIYYNKKFVTETVDSYDILWSEKYKGKVLMFDNSRDAFGIALKKLGYSQNSENEEEYLRAKEELIKQKNVLQAYAMDQIFNKLSSNEAYIAPYYSGDYNIIHEMNPDVEFSIPKEGTNKFVDAACIPINTKNKKAAEMYINFLNIPEVSKANADYIGYATPNTGAYELFDDEVKNNKNVYPDDEILNNTETFRNLSSDINYLIDNYWIDIKGVGSVQVNKWTMPFLIFSGIILIIFLNIKRKIKKNKY